MKPFLQIETEFLFDLDIEVETPIELGLTQFGRRRIFRVTCGKFRGPKLEGRVLEASADWLIVRDDGTIQQDVRLTLETTDNALILMKYMGLRHGSEEVMQRLASGEDVDPSEYYFRTSPVFETGADDYKWLNSIIAVGTGRRTSVGASYSNYMIA